VLTIKGRTCLLINFYNYSDYIITENSFKAYRISTQHSNLSILLAKSDALVNPKTANIDTNN